RSAVKNSLVWETKPSAHGVGLCGDIGVAAAQVAARGSGAARVADPDRGTVAAGAQAGGVPVEGGGGGVSLSDLPCGRAWGEDPELVERVRAAGGAGREGDRGAGQRRRARRRGLGD